MQQHAPRDDKAKDFARGPVKVLGVGSPEYIPG